MKLWGRVASEEGSERVAREKEEGAGICQESNTMETVGNY